MMDAAQSALAWRSGDLHLGLRSAPYRRVGGVTWRCMRRPMPWMSRSIGSFFEPNWATIMTSATLTADRRFDPPLSRIGLVHGRLIAVTSRQAFPSPFDHAPPSWVW